jgi:hypothetical protein
MYDAKKHPNEGKRASSTYIDQDVTFVLEMGRHPWRRMTAVVSVDHIVAGMVEWDISATVRFAVLVIIKLGP